jgi:hypothetical protein
VGLAELSQDRVNSRLTLLRKLCFFNTHLVSRDSKGLFPDDPGHRLCTRWCCQGAIIHEVQVRELRHQPGQREWLQEPHGAVGQLDSLQRLHYLLKTCVVVLCFRDLNTSHLSLHFHVPILHVPASHYNHTSITRSRCLLFSRITTTRIHVNSRMENVNEYSEGELCVHL